MTSYHSELRHYKRLVIKFGSSLLAHHMDDSQWLPTVAHDIAALHHKGCQVVVVSSGAVALGRHKLNISKSLSIEESQAAAAVGQPWLTHLWQEAFASHGITVAQVLLTAEDTENRRAYLNARATIDTLLALKALPVINENDAVATRELRYGDNDRLAAQVAGMIGAQGLVMLSNVDGLYTTPPSLGKSRLIPVVKSITPAIESLGSSETSPLGRGGMKSKIQAARIAMGGGCTMVLANGLRPHPIKHILHGGAATWFPSSVTPQDARKRWISGLLAPQGVLSIDAGAARALQEGNSLLPAGVLQVEGTFNRGDMVLIRTSEGQEIARGLCTYGHQDAHAIKGHKSNEIEGILGYRRHDAIVHRDNMIFTEGTPS